MFIRWLPALVALSTLAYLVACDVIREAAKDIDDRKQLIECMIDPEFPGCNLTDPAISPAKGEAAKV